AVIGGTDKVRIVEAERATHPGEAEIDEAVGFEAVVKQRVTQHCRFDRRNRVLSAVVKNSATAIQVAAAVRAQKTGRTVRSVAKRDVAVHRREVAVYRAGDALSKLEAFDLRMRKIDAVGHVAPQHRQRLGNFRVRQIEGADDLRRGNAESARMNIAG